MAIKVLVVDDEQEFAELLSERLEARIRRAEIDKIIETKGW
jgi:CheY-like chemotaxis protein